VSIIIQYEKLVLNIREELRLLGEFLELPTEIPVHEVERESLDRWRSNLTAENCIDIEKVTGYPR
jgi:hypothetical protein